MAITLFSLFSFPSHFLEGRKEGGKEAGEGWVSWGRDVWVGKVMTAHRRCCPACDWLTEWWELGKTQNSAFSTCPDRFLLMSPRLYSTVYPLRTKIQTRSLGSVTFYLLLEWVPHSLSPQLVSSLQTWWNFWDTNMIHMLYCFFF